MHRRARSRDEELAKRDDDFRPRRQVNPSFDHIAPWRWRKRRVLTVLAGILGLYFVISIIPFDYGPIAELDIRAPLQPGSIAYTSKERQEPSGAPPPSENDEKSDDSSEEHGQQSYNGPIKFYRLASSLHGISRTMGSRPSNRNVLFAASSLKSVANLMPMACEMGKWDRNYVHLAIMGRSTLSLEEILEVNGIQKDSCLVYFHDARGDYAEFSSDTRAEVSVTGAMKHINDFMHPQAIIMDDNALEDSFFTRGMRIKSKELGRALIEVPAGRYEDFLWMTRLDSGSLGSWYKPSIDILIHAPPESSGGLIRLVKSLEKAEYAGLKTPKVTIEMPQNIEYFARRYLENLDWPPEKQPTPLKTKGLTLRHRIPSARLTSEQASLRFVESFYPISTNDHHLLVLSPQAEVNPLFLQYLHYTLLEYRYSAYEVPEHDDLLGISLDVPSSFLNGSAGFVQPMIANMQAEKFTGSEKLDQSAPAPFLYQAPSATASLIFGDKWATLHDYFTNRLASSQAGTAEKSQKLVSETEPAWLEYLLELMRARGWSMLHPSAPFVTVHNELAQIPEEYVREEREKQKSAEPSKQLQHADEEAFLTAPDPPALQQHIEQDSTKGLLPLQEVLPFSGDLPELPHLPLLYYTGDIIDRDSAKDYKEHYVSYSRQHVGGCDAKDAARTSTPHDLSTDDLFCLPGADAERETNEEAEVVEALVKSTDPPAVDGGADAADIEPAARAAESSKATAETREETRAAREAVDS